MKSIIANVHDLKEVRCAAIKIEDTVDCMMSKKDKDYMISKEAQRIIRFINAQLGE